MTLPSQATDRRRPQRRRLVWGAMALAVLAALVLTGPRLYRHLRSSAPREPSPAARAAMAQVSALQQAGQYDQAIAVARAHLVKEPDAPSLHAMLGMLHGAKGDFHAAAGAFEEGLKRNPEDAKSHLGLGIALSRLSDLDRANQHLRKSLETEPNSPDTTLLLGHNLALLGLYPEAEKYLLASVAARPVQAYVELGLMYRTTGDLARASDALRQVLAADPKNREALYNLGQILIRSGHEEEGKQLLASHEQLAEQADRLDFLNRSTEQPGTPAENFVLLAQAQAKHGDLAKAAEAYHKALARDARLTAATVGLANIYMGQGNLEEASRWLDRSLEIDPRHSVALYLRGIIHLQRGETKPALAALEQSRKLGGWTDGMTLQLGKVYLNLGRTQEALEAFATCLKLNPKRAEAYLLQGFVSYREGKLAQAKAQLDKALEVDQKDGDSAMASGIVSFRMGDRGAAEAAFREALKRQRATLFSQQDVDAMLGQFVGLPDAQEALAFYRQIRVQEQTAGASAKPSPAG